MWQDEDDEEEAQQEMLLAGPRSPPPDLNTTVSETRSRVRTSSGSGAYPCQRGGHRGPEYLELFFRRRDPQHDEPGSFLAVDEQDD